MYAEMMKELIQPATWHCTSSQHLRVITPALKHANWETNLSAT